MEKERNNKKLILSVILLAAVLTAAAVLYMVFVPKAAAGSKAIEVVVVDDAGEKTTYQHKTDAEYLRQALEEIPDFTMEGEEGDYGLYVKTVNGLTADYDTDGAYWSIYVNGAYGQYSVDQQPVQDGDSFSIQYEVAQ